MSSPLEDEIWNYIVRHRGLKLIFIAVTLIGVLASAIKTMDPLRIEATQLVTRYLISTPSPQVKKKYGCAYDAGIAYWKIIKFLRDSPPHSVIGLAIEDTTTSGIRVCQRIFEFSPTILDIDFKLIDRSTAPADDIEHYGRTTINNLNEFKDHLAIKDRAAFALMSIGSELELSRIALNNFHQRAPKAFSTAPLHNDLKDDIVEKLNRLHAEARDNFPYKLPPLNLKTTSADALLQSIVAAQTRYAVYFRAED